MVTKLETAIPNPLLGNISAWIFTIFGHMTLSGTGDRLVHAL